MQTGGAIALILAGTGLGLVVVFVLWRRLSSGSVMVLLGAFAMLVGAGALLLQAHPAPTDWLVTLAVLAVGAPLHFRWLLGPPGPARRRR